MPRTTDAAVKEILATALNTMPFIMTASVLVDAYLGTSGLSEPHLSEIERWWAAHLVTIREPQVAKKDLGDTSVTFVRGQLKTGLEATLYGQTVLQLDTTGTLAMEVTEASEGVTPARIHVF